MCKLSFIWCISGFYFWLGTAGSSDLNLISIREIIKGLLIALMLFGISYITELYFRALHKGQKSRKHKAIN